MNSDTSLAAWLIAGGPRTINPADARNVANVRELAAHRSAAEGQSLAARLGATIAAFRAVWQPEPELACCPA
jgi:hypothetical protein